MKINLPVTQQEFILKDNIQIVFPPAGLNWRITAVGSECRLMNGRFRAVQFCNVNEYFSTLQSANIEIFMRY